MTAYYNEFDPMAAAWLRELIKAGLIPDGEVDTRSITDVRASDLIGFAIKKAAKDESLSQLFSFDWKGRRVVGAFNLVDGLADGKTAFYYSFCEEKTLGFARYDYREDRVDFSDSMGEHAYMYAKVVNLAEPFPFFKP